MIVTADHWKEFDKLGIDKNLVEECESGIWFKNIGNSMVVNNQAKFKLVELNTKIQIEQ